ncbi:MAG TPA: hypothetical protein VMH87_07430 [Pseudomonadales bacterium]|nr:hypothetical protein [Pseudomonadales bacterium]
MKTQLPTEQKDQLQRDLPQIKTIFNCEKIVELDKNYNSSDSISFNGKSDEFQKGFNESYHKGLKHGRDIILKIRKRMLSDTQSVTQQKLWEIGFQNAVAEYMEIETKQRCVAHILKQVL